MHGMLAGPLDPRNPKRTIWNSTGKCPVDRLLLGRERPNYWIKGISKIRHDNGKVIRHRCHAFPP